MALKTNRTAFACAFVVAGGKLSFFLMLKGLSFEFLCQNAPILGKPYAKP